MNLAIARKVKKLFAHRVRIVFYPCPQVWLWRSYRLKKIDKYIDRCFLLFPVEQEFYKKKQVVTQYQCVGHPFTSIYSDLKVNPSKDRFRIGLFPGSRPKEVKKIWPIFVDLIKTLPSHLSFSVCVPPFLETLIQSMVPLSIRSRIQFHSSVQAVFQESYIAIGCIGTILLESVYFEVPIIGIYSVSPFIYKSVSYCCYSYPYYTLPNLLSQKWVIPEIIGQGQEWFDKMRDQLLLLLNDKKIYAIVKEDLCQLKDQMFKIGRPEVKVAEGIKEELKKSAFFE